MTSNLLKIYLDTSKNAFIADVTFELYGVRYTTKAKIDTGCTLSVFPIKKILKYEPNKSIELKRRAIAENTECTLGFGVNDSVEFKRKEKALFESGRLMECTSIKFRYRDIPITINGIALVEDIYVSYDRDSSNTLIGIDILKDFEVHIGTSLLDGRYLLLACSKNGDKKEYYKEMSRHFNLVDKNDREVKLVRKILKFYKRNS